MNSTDPARRTKRDARRLFRRRMIPLAQVLAANGIRYYADAPNDAIDSYFDTRGAGPADLETFLEPGLDSPEAMEQALRRMWNTPESIPLRDLAHGLASLAGDLRSDGAEPTGDIPPYIYAMF